ncbi:MAG: hypothetical protein JWR73_1733 [Tardiphaga sp.]|nr:hypothetical protein [Tardiphaga sp.]
MAATTASNHEIARLANAHARADFATWQMMAKLKSVDALPNDAQEFYAGYLRLLERPKTTTEMATEATIKVVYARYYEKMGGTGKPPRIEPAPRSQPTPAATGTDNVTPFRRIKPAASAPARKKSLPVALIFTGMIAIAVAFHFAKTGF